MAGLCEKLWEIDREFERVGDPVRYFEGSEIFVETILGWEIFGVNRRLGYFEVR